MESMRWSVLIVDDHDGFRREARALLEADGLDVVGEAGTAAAAIAETTRLRPRLVVLDIGLPDRSGLDFVVALREASPGAVVVLVSGRAEVEFGGRVAAAGADAFIEKARLVPGTIPALMDGRSPA
jgi:DNA-binding NarL/FixJ family response regulator